MNVAVWDEVWYHHELCEVEQVWEDDAHVCYCALRPYSHPDGLYLTEQENLVPLPRTTFDQSTPGGYSR